MRDRRRTEEGRDRLRHLMLRLLEELAATAPQPATRAATAAVTACLLQRLVTHKPHRLAN